MDFYSKIISSSFHSPLLEVCTINGVYQPYFGIFSEVIKNPPNSTNKEKIGIDKFSAIKGFWTRKHTIRKITDTVLSMKMSSRDQNAHLPT